MTESSGGDPLSAHAQSSIAMVTAWLTASPGLMDSALPEAETITRLASYPGRTSPTVNGVIAEYDAVRDVAIELSLLCATALSCWANSMGINPEDVLRDLAVRQSTVALEAE